MPPRIAKGQSVRLLDTSLPLAEIAEV